MSEYNDIKTPEELLEYMDNNINYGFYGIDGKIYTPSNSDFNKEFDKKWVLSDAKRLIKYKYGNCFDQVELERDWFKKNNYEFKTFFIWFFIEGENNNYFTHTFLVYKEGEKNKWCYFEHSDYKNKGIHEFDSLEDAVNFQRDLHIKLNRNEGRIINDEVISKLITIEYNDDLIGLSSEEFYNRMYDLTIKSNLLK